MTKIQQTPEKLKVGISVPTNQVTTLQVNIPAVEILIGGPYTLNGEKHSYGHAALRVITIKEERIYDFGRYGQTKGLFDEQGEGILRVWSKFDSYIKGENSYGRVTTGFFYPVLEEKATAINNYFNAITANASSRYPKHPDQKEFKLVKDYDAVTNNCATTTLDGAKIALPELDRDYARFNIGRGMTDAEKTAAKVHNFGWPSKIFMPADIHAMLEGNKKIIPKKITPYRGEGK